MVTWLYSLTMMFAIVACSVLLRRFQKKLPLEPKEKLLIGLAAFIGAMIGAKLPFLIFQLWQVSTNDSTQTSWSSVLLGSWFANGKTIMFGIVGGYFAVEFAKWILSIKTRTGDSFAVPVAVGVALGRLGCFFAGCCHGVETELPWGVHFTIADGDSEVLRHPTQIYEFLFHTVAASVLLVFYLKLYRNNKPLRQRPGWFEIIFWGNLIKAYILLYLFYRIATEEIRPEPEIWLSLTAYQWFAIFLVPVFLMLWTWDVVGRIGRLSAENPSAINL